MPLSKKEHLKAMPHVHTCLKTLIVLLSGKLLAIIISALLLLLQRAAEEHGMCEGTLECHYHCMARCS